MEPGRRSAAIRARPSRAAYWFAALGATLLFFGCLLGHELAHAFVARHRHIEVEGIVLWLLGGPAN